MRIRAVHAVLAFSTAGCELFGFYGSPPTDCRREGCGDGDADAESDTDADSDGDGGGSPDADVDVDASVDTGQDAGTNRDPDASDEGCGLGELCEADAAVWGAHCDAEGVCRRDVDRCQDGDASGYWRLGGCCTGCWSDEDQGCMAGIDVDACGYGGERCQLCPASCRFNQCASVCGAGCESIVARLGVCVPLAEPQRGGDCQLAISDTCCGWIGSGASCGAEGCE